MNFGDAIKHLADAPHWLWAVLVMFFFGIAWKRSEMPNHWLKYLQWILPIVLYPALELSLSEEPAHRFRNPYVALALAGLLIAIVNLAFHETIVYLLKSKCPWLKWDDSEPVPPPTP